MNTYFISDLHFGHKNIIRFDNRPFSTVDEMDKALINNWNDTIKEEDWVYILGDISWYGVDTTAIILSKLKGHKVLIKGNHDKFTHEQKLTKYFEYITDYKELYFNGQIITLCHYPIMYWKNQWHGTIHLYGHVHVTQDYQHLLNYIANERKIGNPCKMYNVGCMIDYMNYKPRTLKEIIKNK
jgi:calcineurin-like phosphoesterase family protein